MNDGDGCGHVHCVAFAFHRQHRVDPLAQGPRALLSGIELPGETAKPGAPEHNANRCVAAATRPSEIFAGCVFFMAVYVSDLDVSRRAAERADSRAWRSARGRGRPVAQGTVCDRVSRFAPAETAGR